MDIKKLFTDHPHSVGETYLQHLKYASIFGFNMVWGGLACMLHAVFPCACKRTGSDILLKEIKKWINRMSRLDGRFLEINQRIEAKLKLDKVE